MAGVNEAQRWRDAYTLRISLRCMALDHPDDARECREMLRRSRRFRKSWLTTCRSNPLFVLYCGWIGPSGLGAAMRNFGKGMSAGEARY